MCRRCPQERAQTAISERFERVVYHVFWFAFLAAAVALSIPIVQWCCHGCPVR
jgi:hypothetical protein